ncbi:MAG TPA: hypothetical protein VJZ91_16770 [Blastocatellia bacterium]|nr:hypothetical protein [Blastocatellia bacterium]
MSERSGFGFINSIYAVPPDYRALYLFNTSGQGADIYREEPAASTSHITNTPKPALSDARSYTAYQDSDSKVFILDSTGKQVARFSTYPVYSLNILSNGNVVVASPVGKNFLHIYDLAGRLIKSFGQINVNVMPEVDDAEKRFLHQGKVLIDAADNIYYVFQFIPLIEKYSPAGKLLVERQVRGEAIEMQQELAQRFLRNKALGAVGGIDVINSATLDPLTGHLWICMNGSSSTGVVYEYSEQGDKLREYALEVNSWPPAMHRITAARDIAITMSNLYVLTSPPVVISFNIRGESTWKLDSDVSTQDAGACGTQQNWNSCSFICPGVTCSGGQPTATSSDGSPLDCRRSLQQALAPNYVLIQSTCTTYPAGYAGNPGQQIPAHMRGACQDNVTVCYSGQNYTVSVVIDSPAPPSSACSGAVVSVAAMSPE